MNNNNAYIAKLLPLTHGEIDQSYFFEELIDATTKLEVYKEKIKDSKLDASWFMPTLQQKEALASSKLEGTQATLDGVLINQVTPNDKDQNLNEVNNYHEATVLGYDILRKRDFSDEFFKNIHTMLMHGNVRKPEIVGQYRTKQNYIGKSDKTHAVTFVPPTAEDVPGLMSNLINYMNNSADKFRPLVRCAIVHAQFETIHPFMDGNGRVGRILIPMYLFAQKQIDLPCFFISEALERDKIKYYTLLNNIRTQNDWNGWIKFFLTTVTRQCDKYIEMLSRINSLYNAHVNLACQLSKSSHMVDLINMLYKYPITTVKQMSKKTNISHASVNRYMTQLVENQILFTDEKIRKRTFYYCDLLDILRD